MRSVIINGTVTTPETAGISVYDRGFLYGDSVFETIRTYGGRPFAVPLHLARLARSAERVFIALPVSLETFAAEVDQATTLAANPESYIRVMLTRGTGPMGLDPDLAEAPNRIVFVEPLVAPTAEAYANGIDVVIVRTARTTDDTPAAGAKVGNYLTSLLALREARRRGAVEAFIVDGRGRVLEGTTSNVFLVKQGRLVTAPEESGILAGITRQYLLEAAARLGIDVELRDILDTELFDADEVFISSSIREVLSVVHIDGRAVGGAAPGPLTRRLHAEFRRHVTGG